MKVRISDTDANSDWIKWRTNDVLGVPADKDRESTFLDTLRKIEPPIKESPFAGVVRRRGRKRG